MSDLSKLSDEELLALYKAKQGAASGTSEAPMNSPDATALEPRLAQQRDSETLKPTFMAAGGTLGSIVGGGLGAAAGAPAGGVGAIPGSLAGAVAGGALGTAGGAYAYDLYRDVKRLFVDDETVPPSPANRLLDPVKEGLIDAAVSGGIAGLPAVAAGWRGAKRAFFGVGDEAARLAGEAERKGIPLGIGDVAESTPVRTVTQTLGRMPLIGGPMRRAQGVKAEQVEGAFGRELGALGAEAETPVLGREMAQRAEGFFRNVMQNEIKPLYEQVKTLSAQEGAKVPAHSLANAAAKAEVEMMKDRPSLGTGKEMSQVAPEYLRNFVTEMQELPSHLSVANLQWLKRNIDSLAKKAQTDGFQWTEAMGLRNAVQKAIDDAAPGSLAAQALKRADETFQKRMELFENATGKKFEQVDKNMFSYGHVKPGTVNADELAQRALNAKSPEAIDALERLVGPDLVGKLSRRYVGGAFEAAHSINDKGQRVFDVRDFIERLKLNQPHSAEYAALKRMYEHQGGDVKDLVKLTEIAQRVFGNEVPDVSTFVARRAMLGGAKSGLMAVLPGVGTAGVHVAAGGSGAAGLPVLAGVLLARHGMKIASEPRYLKMLLRGYDPNVAQGVRRTALVRLGRFLAREEGTPSEGETANNELVGNGG